MFSEESIPILKKLVASIQGDNDEKVLRYSEQVLIMNSDQDITRCKIVALVKLNKFDQAMQIQKGLTMTTPTDAFVKAYLSYKLGKFKEAVDI